MEPQKKSFNPIFDIYSNFMPEYTNFKLKTDLGLKLKNIEKQKNKININKEKNYKIKNKNINKNLNKNNQMNNDINLLKDMINDLKKTIDLNKKFIKETKIENKNEQK